MPGTGTRSTGVARQIILKILRACRKFLALTVRQAWRSTLSPLVLRRPMILSAIAERLKRRSKDDFRGRHFEAPLILQAVCWYLRYPLSYRVTFPRKSGHRVMRFSGLLAPG
jgi:hypothetical protein